MPLVIPIKYKSTATLKPSKFTFCLACKLATTKAQSDGVKTTKLVAAKDGILSSDQYKPGDPISTDHFIVKMPGHLSKDFGKEIPQK